MQNLRGEEIIIGHLETNDIETELMWLWFKCNKNANEMTCDIFQTSIAKEASDEEIAKKIAEIKSKNNKDDFEQAFGKACSNKDEFEKAAKTISETKKSLDGRILKTTEVRDVTEFMSLLTKACSSKSTNDIDNFLISFEKKKKNSCVVLNNLSTEKFNWDAASSTWVSRTGPTGPCGTITVGSLRIDKQSNSNFWLYSETRFLSNPNAKTQTGLSCSAFSNRTYNYSWRANERYMECDTVKNLMH